MPDSYSHKHHQLIESALNKFSSKYLVENNIYFGGGTRIALELDEFRESVDIDFFCSSVAAYRAVRNQVTNISLGDLVTEEFTYEGDIRADRDAVRARISVEGVSIKLEFISFPDYSLAKGDDIFPVPCVDRNSCFYTKLLANADRYGDYPYKDIIDLCAMFNSWGEIPEESIKLAQELYGDKVVIPNLRKALESMLSDPQEYRRAAEEVLIASEDMGKILEEAPRRMLEIYS